ncbi:MAG: hypothetical protein EPN22_12110 [Nitrospirae bacterium]|nr:MAG: hypothetical protein EPN22_12110 [Nitrospirota bacterium]
MSIDDLSRILSSIGLVSDLAGAWLVAIEVVSQYKGKKYEENIPIDKMATPVQETEEYKNFEQMKYIYMKLGLGFLTVGFCLQLLANLIYIPSIKSCIIVNLK